MTTSQSETQVLQTALADVDPEIVARVVEMARDLARSPADMLAEALALALYRNGRCWDLPTLPIPFPVGLEAEPGEDPDPQM
jgi:hypothetical protein